MIRGAAAGDALPRRRGACGWLLALAVSAAGAQTLATPHCDERAAAPRPLPDAAVCLAREGVSGAAPAAAQALYARAQQHMGAVRLDAAAQALDCAQAVIGRDPDWRLRYELVRLRGVLAYRREAIPEALGRFECALQLASAHEDRGAVARDLKNIGSALRRLGDFRGALQALTRSLALQRAQGEVGGAVLNNIGDVYRELDEPDEALRHYRQALAAFRGQGNAVEAAHVLESMSALSLDRDQPAQAEAWLREALQAYRHADHRAYQLRVYAGLMRAALARGDLAQARQWRGTALALAAEHRLPLPAALQLQAARSERLDGAAAAAESRLRGALAALAPEDVERIGLLEELSLAQESGGDRAAALATLRRAQVEERALTRAQQDRRLGWLRTRFETAERDRTIAALAGENRLRRAELRQRTLWLWLILAVAVAAALALGLWLLRRRQHARLLQVRHEEALQRYRRETDALAEDRSLLQALLDSRQDAVCLVDAEGQLLAANRSARELLGLDPAAPLAQALGDCLADADRAALAATLERMEDAAALRLDFARSDGTALQAQLAPWERGDGLIVLGLSAASAAAPAVAADPEAGASDAEARDEFRRALVELMLAVVETWERSTGSGRLELAEKSRIWRVTIDDGRLRARAMERYLSLSKLPRQPRWRDVLRSAYYVLGQCAMEPAEREALQRRVDAALVYTRRRALV